MIGRVHKRGSRVGGLLRYLFGPGKAEEHINPRLVGAWDGSGPLADLEPEVTATGARDFRHLVAMLEEPVRAAERAPRKFVWHTSMRLAPEDRHREFSDQTWAHMAREMLATAGIAPHGDDAGLRWVVVRHNDDHVHIVATTVREDGRIDWLRNDYPRVVDATFEVARRFGLRRQVPRPDRTATRAPRPEEANKARRLGRPRTDRDELRTRVRTAAASSTSEAEFFEQLRRAGVLINLRESTQRPGEITGYSVALPPEEPGRTPIYFSGGKLAPDLTLPKLRHRWGAPPPNGQRPQPRVSRAERVRVMREASATAQAAATQMRADLRTDPAAAQATAEAAADTLRAVAAAMEGRRGGPITDAADAFDRAARAGTGPAGRHTPASYRMRSTARLVSLMGRISGDEDALAALKLVLKIAALGDTLSQLRHAQARLHQAQAARQAATDLRAAATRSVTPPATPNRTFDGGPAHTGRRPSPTRTGGRR